MKNSLNKYKILPNFKGLNLISKTNGEFQFKS